jgi:hypothetical protein
MDENDMREELIKSNYEIVESEQHFGTYIKINTTRDITFQAPAVCIDPSLFTNSSERSTVRMVNDLSMNMFDFYVSEAFYSMVVDMMNQGGEPIYPSDQTTLDFFAGKTSFEPIEPTAEILEYLPVTPFNASEYLSEESSRIYDNLLTTLPTPPKEDGYSSSYHDGGTRLGDILFEEMIFGLNMSPIISRIKKVVNRFRDGSDFTVELSRQLLKGIIEDIDDISSDKRQALRAEIARLERRSRNRHSQAPNEPVNKIAIFREMLKDYPSTNWISYLLKTTPAAIGAASGAAVGGIPGAAVGAGTVGTVGHYFADP